MTAARRGHRHRRGRAQRAGHRRRTGTPPAAARAASAASRASTRRGTRPGSPGRCRASTPRTTCRAGSIPQTDRMTRLALRGRGLGAGRRRRRPGGLAEIRHGRGHRQLLRRLRVRPARAAERCGARAASTSARTSPSPGSTRSTPARSPSGTACAAPAACVVSDQAGGLDAIAQARPADPQGQPADRVRRRRRGDLPLGLGGAARRRTAEHQRRRRHGPTCPSTPTRPGTCRARAARS